MGLGDSLLAAGQARLLHERTGETVLIGNPEKREVHWFDLFDHIHYLSKERGYWLEDYPGVRGYFYGYVEHKDGSKQLIFNPDYRAMPCEIDIDPIEHDYIIIEPNIKRGASLGKQWHSYQGIADRHKCLQFNGPYLKGVKQVKTNFYDAARYMAGARAYIGAEGFLHHLAAAFGTPAVVLFGGYAPPEILGYEYQHSLAVDSPEELGWQKEAGAMKRISLDDALLALDDCLNGNDPGIRWF